MVNVNNISKIALKENGKGVIYINIPTNLNELDETFDKALKNFNILPSRSLLKQIAQKILYFKTTSGKFVIILFTNCIK